MQHNILGVYHLATHHHKQERIFSGFRDTNTRPVLCYAVGTTSRYFGNYSSSRLDNYTFIKHGRGVHPEPGHIFFDSPKSLKILLVPIVHYGAESKNFPSSKRNIPLNFRHIANCTKNMMFAEQSLKPY